MRSQTARISPHPRSADVVFWARRAAHTGRTIDKLMAIIAFDIGEGCAYDVLRIEPAQYWRALAEHLGEQRIAPLPTEFDCLEFVGPAGLIRVKPAIDGWCQ